MDNNKDTIVLKKFDGKSYAFPDYLSDDWKQENIDNIRSGLVIDVETTGTSYAHDQIIELAMLPFKFNKNDGALIEVNESYSSFNEIREGAEPLSEFVSQLTGIVENDLAGQMINWDVANQLLKTTDLVIAHNAKFDRAFLDAQSLVSKSKHWGCSMSQIDWMAKGFRTRGLELLCQRHGFFVNSHRALSDTEATLHLITSIDKETAKPYLKELLENVKIPQIILEATHAPFESKDLLKSRSYRWSPEKRVWSKLVVEAALEEEKEWLSEKVYPQAMGDKSTAYKVPLKDTFKAD